MPGRLPSNTLAALAFGAAATLGHAQAVPPGPPPDWGHDFVTIGAPGNRGVLPSEAPNWNFDALGTFGDVGYEYRITRTEVTNTQYFEFINQYTKTPGFNPGDGSSAIGFGIGFDGFDPLGNPILFIIPGAEHAPANPSWEFAARYTNWLHNDKGTRLEDFESGVYDTSTFGVDPDTGARTDQIERSPGSRFFLPTHDEWTKAAHYDPNRYGPGKEGYWLYPGGSDDPLVSGEPGEPGAETSVGQDPDGYTYYPVGSYPDTDQPWGLLDTSGGTREWLETVLDPMQPARWRLIAGSDIYDPFGTRIEDRLDQVDSGLMWREGFRVGSVVPAPGVGSAMLVGLAVAMTRRRRS
jgi:hypothetical protein